DSIGPRKNRAALRRLGAVHALPVAAFLLQRNTAHRRARFFLDLRFALGASAPERVRKTGLHRLFQFVVVFRFVRVTFAKRERLVVERLLNVYQQLPDRRRQIGERRTDLALLAGAVAPRQNRRLLRPVFGPQLRTQRPTATLTIVKFPAGAVPFPLVHRTVHNTTQQLRSLHTS